MDCNLEKKNQILKYSATFIVSIFILSSVPSNAQTKSNLDVFNNLVDKASDNIIATIPDSVKFVNLKLNFNGDYSVFKNKITSKFNDDNNFKTTQDNKGLEVSVSLENASVNYGEMFRKNFLGSFYLERNLILEGNFILDENNKPLQNFNFTYKDTVKVSEINSLENTAYPFTRATVPSEPFLSNIYEPIIAVGTAAVAIFLFFAIRSK